MTNQERIEQLEKQVERNRYDICYSLLHHFRALYLMDWHFSGVSSEEVQQRIERLTGELLNMNLGEALPVIECEHKNAKQIDSAEFGAWCPDCGAMETYTRFTDEATKWIWVLPKGIKR